MSMTSSDLKSEVLNGPERRRRRTAAEKLVIVAETHEPGALLVTSVLSLAPLRSRALNQMGWQKRSCAR